ncbi:MAG TPA: hypothetical protein EYP14_18520 [Planctomycetaceae bacterium]|nr:hypothetical protein [Planctomycetaceae bacterium]
MEHEMASTEFVQADLNRIVLPEEQGPNLWEVVVRRKWLIVSMTIVGAALGVLYYAKCAPVYESTARVLVQRSAPLTLQSDPKSLFAAKVAQLETQSSLIRSPLVVSPAVFGIPYEMTSRVDRELVRRIEAEASIMLKKSSPISPRAQSPS